MKNIKMMLMGIVVTAGTFSTAVFTACTKVDCANVVCNNGGSCSGGVCSCPTGYTGTFCESVSSTSIVYKNNTFTPISIAVNGDEAVIPVGGSVSFTGKFGTDAVGTATTSGAASSLGISSAGGIIGLPINWSISDKFPASDTLRVPLDIGSTYFFLRITNNSPKDVINYYVNFKFPYGEYYSDVTIPNNGKTYDMGYYLAYPNGNVRTQSAGVGSKVDSFGLVHPFTSNQVSSVVVVN